MQPTDVQVQASLEALATGGAGERSAVAALGGVRDLTSLPAGLLDALSAAPLLREERLVAARRRLDAGAIPSGEDLAGRMVGRIVCDRLR